MLTAGIAILTGVLFACYSPQILDSFVLSWLPLCLLLSYYNTGFRLTGLFIAGFLWTQAVMQWELDHRLQPEWNNKRLVVVGEVINLPRSQNHYSSFYFRPLSIEGIEANLPRKIKLSWRAAPEHLSVGQVWQLEVKLKRPHGFQNPGGFDYEKWLFVQKVHATGYVLNKPPARLIQHAQTGFNEMRSRVVNHIQQYCAACQYQGLIQGLAVGYRGNIDQQQRRTLQQTGTAHLIAISGLHIGIIAGVFYALGRIVWSALFVGSGVSRKTMAMSFAWLGGFCYGLLSGFDLPAQRACIMLSILWLGFMLRLPFNLLHAIVVAMILVLVISPLSVLTASFWLTFCALLIIAFAALLLKPSSTRKYFRWRQILVIQVLFSVLFIPLSVAIFGQIHSASLLANLIAVPLVSIIIVPFNFLLLLLFWLPADVLIMLYSILDFMLLNLMKYLNGLQLSGFEALSLSRVSEWRLMLLFVLLMLLLMPRGLITRRRYFIWLPGLLLWNEPELDEGLKMTLLDVGMGTSIVIQTPHHHLLYDFGPGNKQGYSLGAWVVKPFLRHQGLMDPDRIVLSHSDQDHVGGLFAVSEHFRDISVYSGTAKAVRQLFPNLNTVYDCHNSAAWTWDGIQFEFLHGLRAANIRDNNQSCVLKVTYQDQVLLLAGDIEAVQEKNLIANTGVDLSANTLIAPHHGSMTSSSRAFIDAVSAERVLFSVGYLNRWQFPRAEVVERYRKSGAEIVRSDLSGAIQLDCNNNHCNLSAYRRQHPRLWY